MLSQEQIFKERRKILLIIAKLEKEIDAQVELARKTFDAKIRDINKQAEKSKKYWNELKKLQRICKHEKASVAQCPYCGKTF